MLLICSSKQSPPMESMKQQGGERSCSTCCIGAQIAQKANAAAHLRFDHSQIRLAKLRSTEIGLPNDRFAATSLSGRSWPGQSREAVEH
jgi:hypothetical protein